MLKPDSTEIKSPLKQTQSGILIEDIRCKDSLGLLIKHDGSPACVKPSSVEKLIERGWNEIRNSQTRHPISTLAPSDPMSITINGSHTPVIIPIKAGEAKEMDILLDPKNSDSVIHC